MDSNKENSPPRDMPAEDYLRWQENDLSQKIPLVMENRRAAGLEGLVQGLEALVINTEPVNLEPAVEELLRFTGFEISEHFHDPEAETYVLGVSGSASLLLRARKAGTNPFLPFNQAEKARDFPNTRLETFIFRTRDLDTYVNIQKSYGVPFLTNEIQQGNGYRYIQTLPSQYTGNSIGFIEWEGSHHSFSTRGSKDLPISLEKPDLLWLSRIHSLDHTATRVRAIERNQAILEFLSLTGYHFDFAVFVKSQNSITSVARLSRDDFAMVFTSGIAPYSGDADSGPTERFIHNFGTRVHHMAFRTDEIDSVFQELRAYGMDFLVDLVGSQEEGLKQTFSMPSSHTMIVNEYIHRYEGFDGFFTRSNVEALTRATGRQ